MKKRILVAGMLLAVWSSYGLVFGSADKSKSTIIAYYFITNVRCSSCMSIERLTGEAIKDNFVGEIDSGRLQFRVLNIDKPGNYHFVKDYKLYTKAVILSEIRDGKELRWKNLDRVWMLLRNEGKFKKYVQDETSAFMDGQ